MREIFGYILIAIPFIAIFTLIVLARGWIGLLFMVVGTAIILGLIGGGLYLITGEGPIS